MVAILWKNATVELEELALRCAPQWTLARWFDCIEIDHVQESLELGVSTSSLTRVLLVAPYALSHCGISYSVRMRTLRRRRNCCSGRYTDSGNSSPYLPSSRYTGSNHSDQCSNGDTGWWRSCGRMREWIRGFDVHLPGRFFSSALGKIVSRNCLRWV
jgi:hypothetical protein